MTDLLDRFNLYASCLLSGQQFCFWPRFCSTSLLWNLEWAQQEIPIPAAVWAATAHLLFITSREEFPVLFSTFYPLAAAQDIQGGKFLVTHIFCLGLLTRPPPPHPARLRDYRMQIEFGLPSPRSSVMHLSQCFAPLDIHSPWKICEGWCWKFKETGHDWSVQHYGLIISELARLSNSIQFPVVEINTSITSVLLRHNIHDVRKTHWLVIINI